MLKEKGGQLTLFVIIAIVVVLSIIVYFYFQGDFLGEKKYDPKVEVLRQNVLDCFNNNYGTALALIGIQGGYYDVPDPKEEIIANYLSYNSLPYYYYEGELNIPTIETIENQLGLLADNSVPSCFENLNNEDYDSIDFSEFSTDVEIKENEVIFTTNVNMNVGYDDKSAIVNFQKTPQTINSDIFNMHEIALFITEYIKNNNEWVPYSDITQKSREYNLYVNIIDSDDGTESNVEILSPKNGFYPSLYQFKNKYGVANYEDIAPLL